MTRCRRCVVSLAAALCLLPGLAPGLLTPGVAAAASPETPVPSDVVALGGTPVGSTTDAGDPTDLAAGTWSDTLGAAGTAEGTHYFAYRRIMADSTVHVGVVGANSVQNDQVQVQVATPEGDDCGSDDASSGYGDPFATFGAAVSAGPDQPGERNAACLVADELRIAVSRGFASTTTDLPIALRVVEEAPTSGAAELPPPPDSLPAPAPDGAGSGETAGATSLAEAPYLEPGGYATSVAEGEQRLWRVRLDWGQQVSVRLEVPPQDAAAQEALDLASDPAVELRLIDPLLASFRDVVVDAETSGSYDEEGSTLRDGSPPVGYPNRFEGVPATVPGDYWVGVSVSAATDRAALDVPMRLEVDVVDAADDTARPTFPDSVLGAGSSAEPAGYDPTTPYLVAAGRFSADVSGTPQASLDDDASGGRDTRRLSGIALALLSAASLAAGLVLLRRRAR